MSSYSPPDITGGPDHGPDKKKGSKKQHANPSTRPISIAVPSRTVDSHHPLNEQQQQQQQPLSNPYILGPSRLSANIINSSAADAGESDGDGNTSNTSPVRGNSIQTPANAPANAPANGKKGALSLLRKDTTSAQDNVKGTKTIPRARSPGTASPVLPSPTDPLSRHIIERTNTDRSLASRFLPTTTTKPETPANDRVARSSPDASTKNPGISQLDQFKHKKKGNSLLSRLSMIGGKKRDDDVFDDGSEISSGARTEGANAIAFAFPADGGGFIPHHKEPPRFIRVRANDKKIKEFNRVFLAQELVGTCPQANDKTGDGAEVETNLHGYHKQDPKSGGPIWAVEFSKDGKYLATGGKDRVLRVWGVLATPEDRMAFEDGENTCTPEGKQQQHLSAPVFHSKPIREFVGHTGDILDLSWSKNNFLLSSSMDRTVRLWHMSRPECLCTFKHNDFVTSISFHPRDDRFFLAGSLDATLRLWSIPDKSVAYSSQMSDIITAVAFSPDGKIAMAGCLNGLCMFYETVGLKYDTQIHVRSSRGKNARGSKITGIRTMSFPTSNSSLKGEGGEGEVKILITSNDSRIRIYNLKDKTLEVKMKGHENSCNQIKASFSDDGKYIICGSEDRKAFIWSTDKGGLDDNKDDRRPYEYFEAHAHAVTEAVFAPTETRQLLQASNDPIYTLCNPPPVMLLSKEELETESLAPTNDAQSETATTTTHAIKKPEESPAFIARSAHHDGNIIVTTDHAGTIKVFRQDCAFAKRRQDNWETGSTFSRKVGKDGFLSRTITRTSASITSSRDPTSRRASLNQGQQRGVFWQQQHQQLNTNTDRIDSWRHGVHGVQHGHMGSSVSISASLVNTPTTVSERSSVSPSMIRQHSPMLTRPTSAVVAGSRPRSRKLTQSSEVSSSNVNGNRNGNGNGASTSDLHALSPATSHSTTGGGGGKIDGERSSSVAAATPKDTSSRFPPMPSFSFRSMDDEIDNGAAATGASSSSIGAAGGVGALGNGGPVAVGANPSSFWKKNRWRNANTGGGSGSGSANNRSVSGASSGLGIFPSSGGGQKGHNQNGGSTAALAEQDER